MLFSQYAMLSDPERTRALIAAVEAAVSPGDVALDLGGGTGFLAMLALRAGAARVMLVERTPIIAIAKKIIQANGFGDGVVFIESDWADAVLPERADVLLTETLGPFGLDEGILGAVKIARERMLRTERGKIMPEALELYVSPVRNEKDYGRISFWDTRPAGLDYSPMSEISACSVWNVRFSEEQLLAPPARVASYDLSRGELDDFNTEVEFGVERDGQAHGFAGWFRARLSGNIWISTGPADPPTHWRQSFFPLHKPFTLKKGDALRLKMISATMMRTTAYHWFAEHIRGGECIERSNHSSALGMEGKPFKA